MADPVIPCRAEFQVKASATEPAEMVRMGFTGWMKLQRRRIALSLSLRVKLFIAASEDQTEVEAFVLVSREVGIWCVDA